MEDPRQGQTHVHEFLGSTQIFEEPGEEPHNHRFAGVSGEVHEQEGGHVHEICTNTDFFEDHHHEVGVRTGPPRWVSPDKHVHFAADQTTTEDQHFHLFQFATLIDNPIEPED
jgi:hypothetical protein